MEQQRGIGAYGLCRGADGRVLLVRGVAVSPYPGVWQLPGGELAHAEHPEHAVVREYVAQTGLRVEVTGLRAAVADVVTFGEPGVALHTDRLVFDVAPATRDDPASAADDPASAADDPASAADGAAAADPAPPAGHATPAGGDVEPAGAEARWFTLAEAAGLPLLPFTAELLGLPVTPLPAGLPRATPPAAPPHLDRRRRFAAYGLVTDPAGRVLLTMIAPGYPGAGQWHLPGGGTDHGEQPATGLIRELVEESGQLGRVLDLLMVDNLHSPAALGPEGRPLDWHGVRVVYRVRVDRPTDAVVTEQAGGSTQRAAWFTSAQLTGLRLTEVAASAIGRAGR
ncbi:NUDIX hydrolase [Micromonospora sp. NPDC000089]|uniref:NUDIX hydrolase n=1 Tax=unclassified Micromonospora TaxID=2617518 RepID=UPI0036AF8913